MKTSIHDAFAPLLLVACLMGMGIFEYPKGRPRILFTFLYIVTLWTFYASFFFGSTTICNMLRTMSLVSLLAIYTNIFVSLISSLVTLCYNKKCYACFKSLEAVDDTLEKLGTRKDYRKVRRSTAIIIIVWGISTFVINYTFTFWSIHNHIFDEMTLIATVLNHAIHANTVGILKFGILVSYAGSRFDRVNEHIRSLIKDGNCEVTCAARAPFVIYSRQSSLEVQKCKETIEILMHVHLEMSRIVREIDTVFGVEMSLHVTAHYFLMTNLLYSLYEAATHKELPSTFIMQYCISMSWWFTLCVVRLFYVNHVADALCAKARETQRYLYKLANCVQDVEVHKDVRQFIMQITCGPPKFTGVGLFVLGYNFLHGFYASMATVLVVMLQMYDPLKYGSTFWNYTVTD